MTFINLSLLLGLGIAAIPVVLHLMLRSRPKRIEFPALRLLEARRTSNARRMKLRHLLLLLLRIAVLVALVMALTRPSLPPARYGLLWYEWLLLLGVGFSAATFYVWRERQLTTARLAAWQRPEYVLKIRVRTLLGALVAALVLVGLPWGLRVRAEIKSPRSDLAEDIPVAAVFVFDTSLSMSYRHESVTRLEQAQRTALEHLEILPSGSRVAVTGTGPDRDIVFQADLTGSHSRIDSLKTQPRVDSLNDLLRRAVEAQKDDQDRVRQELGTDDAGDLFAREVYVFTDLAGSAWNLPDDRNLHELLLEHNEIHVYLVDMSVETPVNIALSRLRMSGESLVAGQSVHLAVDVAATAASRPSAVLDVFLIDKKGTELKPTAPSHLQLNDGKGTAHFEVPAARGDSVQYGVVRTASTDPLSADDLQYFSVGIQPTPRILIVADSDEDAELFYRLLEPVGARLTGDLLYDCTVTRVSQFDRHVLSSYDVICLLNCKQPPDSLWSALRNWVGGGGSLLTILGGAEKINVNRWSSEDCQKVLPGTLLQAAPFRPGPVTFRFESMHPVTRPFLDDEGARSDLLLTPIYRRWSVAPSDDARILMSYTDDRSLPALLEHRVGSGRSMMLTTAFYHNPAEKLPWNGLTDSWSFLMLADQIIQHLTGASDQHRNFSTGDTVEILIPANIQFPEYRLQRPGLRQERRPLEPGQRSILIDDADDPGHYRILSYPDATAFESGFAVNLDDNETNLTPLTLEQLNDTLGEDRYSLVQNPTQLREAVQVGRLGVEVFPVLLGVLVLMFCAEHLMANYFYEQDLSAGKVDHGRSTATA